MNHAEVEATGAVERYLLRELDDIQALAFEEHFFECAECADDVRVSTLFLDNLRVVLREPREMQPRWRRWTLPGSIAAAVLLAFSAGFQGARLGVAPPLALAPAIHAGSVRSGAVTEVSRAQGIASVVIRHEWQSEYSAYVAELLDQNGRTVHSARIPATTGDLSLVFQTARLKPGSYTVVLSGAGPGDTASTPLSRFLLKLTQ